MMAPLLPPFELHGNNFVGKGSVIPATAGIQWIKRFPAQAGQHPYPVHFAGCFFILDSGGRRNDGLMDILG
jgi:hypothetical protein